MNTETPTTLPTWQYLAQPSGRDHHRFWRHNPSSRVSIADLSGDGLYGHVGRPDETDDGPLFLDRNRKALVYQNQCIGGLTVSLPVQTVTGHRGSDEARDAHCGIRVRDLLWLIDHGLWDVRDVTVDGPLTDIARLFSIINTNEGDTNE